MKFIDKHIYLLLIIGIILTFASPFLYLWIFPKCSFTGNPDLGSTIGGLSAPITGILGSVLIYFALTAQRRANYLQSENSRIQFILMMLSKLEEKCENFRFIDDHQERKGIAAFNSIANSHNLEYLKEYFGSKTEGLSLDLMSVINFGNYYSIISDVDLIYNQIQDYSIQIESKKHLWKKFMNIHSVYLKNSMINIVEFYLKIKGRDSKYNDTFLNEIVALHQLLKGKCNLFN
ncbi:MAG: hypothetical protein EOM90_07405 [Alphaproteobacteria bacterium]|nr:hypothetical protein [Alphaproteobacteria bacterium]